MEALDFLIRKSTATIKKLRDKIKKVVMFVGKILCYTGKRIHSIKEKRLHEA